jgi:hypothetical protein
MKKIVAVVIALLLTGIFVPAKVDAKPFYIKVRIGFLAKWSVVLGDCKDGWGICLSVKQDGCSNFIGYDEAVDMVFIKVEKTNPMAQEITQGHFELKEDSPVDPKLVELMTNLNSQSKNLVIKKGDYPVVEEAQYYIIGFNYYFQ